MKAKESMIFILFNIYLLSHIINKNMHSQQQEGFANDNTTQLIDYNYQPVYRMWTSDRKPYSSETKKKPLQSHRLINPSIRTQWVKAIQQSHKHNIIFNNIIKTNVNFVENNISFSSDFQSGNLDIVTRESTNEYSLYMRPDTNTKTHFQWFNFKVAIKKGKRKITFILKNFIKATMLYSKGLKPYCRALKNPDFHQWKQLDTKVKFYQDQIYYCLEFTYYFGYDNDQIQFSSQPPYTFTHLQKFITGIRCKKLTLGKSVMGKKIPYLLFDAKKQVKAAVVVIGRQHPGQAVGSWMMEGLINNLVFNNRNDYITWFIIPMLNVDGVMLGNNRTGILGHDFNRNWIIDESNSSKLNKLFPQIFSVVNLVKNVKKKYQRKLKMFLDLHGHSSQPNVFTYGPQHEEKSQYFYQCRLFPQLMAKKNHNFSLNQCSYVLKPCKKQTARWIMFKNCGVPFTYTIQSTFGVMRDKAVVSDDFIQIGEDIATSAYEFLYITNVKQPHESKHIFQQLKSKYADTKNQGQEYDSASEESDEDPKRMKIEELVLKDDIFDEPIKKEKNRYETIKEQQTYSPQKYPYLSFNPRNNQKFLSVQKHYMKKQKRFNTQGEISKKECLFPTIKTKNTKMSFQQSFFTEQELKQNIKIQEIQKRLYKMRNSKIGKKILVINAYGI